MALVKCRECEAQVSTEALSCPHCGVPRPSSVLSEVAAAPTAPAAGQGAGLRKGPQAGWVAGLAIVLAVGVPLTWFVASRQTFEPTQPDTTVKITLAPIQQPAQTPAQPAPAPDQPALAEADGQGVTTQGATSPTSRNPTMEGTIVTFGCGDNCYLTIMDGKGTEHTGLCAASLCSAWNDAATMPTMYVGKRVRVVIGTGTQYDYEGTAMATTDAFTSIQLLN